MDNNYFKFHDQYYKQIKGLPMGNKLSGILAEIYMDKIESQIVTCNNIMFYYRYVDDTFILTKGCDEANNILVSFNTASEHLRFEIEHPKEGSLNLLEFSVKVVDNRVRIKPYTKPARSFVFINGNTALPVRMTNSAILNEWGRIRKRCDSKRQKLIERKKFKEKLRANGHGKIPRLLLVERERQICIDSPQRFYLTIPFVNEQVDTSIRRALRPLGLQI